MFLAVLCLATFSRATYYIDDTNTTLQYLPGGRQAAAPGVQWHIAQQPEVNITLSYDQTRYVLSIGPSTYPMLNRLLKIVQVLYNFLLVITADFDVIGYSWGMHNGAKLYFDNSFPRYVYTGVCFATCRQQSGPGSGIDIMVVQVNFTAINVSIAVDSLPPTITEVPERGYLHNFSLFAIQELPWGPHSVVVTLLDYTYPTTAGYVYTNGTSGLVFDYAIINEENLAATSSSAQPSATGGSTPSSPKRLAGKAFILLAFPDQP